MTIDQKLDHIDMFAHENNFIDDDYEIPNTKGEIPILNQNLEYRPLIMSMKNIFLYNKHFLHKNKILPLHQFQKFH